MAETEQKDTAAETKIERTDEPKPEVEKPPFEVQPELHTMRSVVLTGHGGYNKIKVEKYAKPKPMEGQVVVKVHACGLNFADLMHRQGHYNGAPKPPYVAGMECAGVVEELGDNVTGIEVGAKVCCIAPYGMWTEFATVFAGSCFVMPDAMTFEEGAALPVTYLTAHLALFHCGNLGRRKSVLIHMAAGGVGTAATQLCKSVEGVTVFGTASESKHEVIKENGVDHPIDYRNNDYVQEVKKITAGVDLVLDPLGGSETKKCYDLLKPMGAVVCFGNAAETKGVLSKWLSGVSFQPSKLIHDSRTVCGLWLAKLAGCPELMHETMKDIMRLYNEGIVKPKIDSVFALEEVPKAMQRMHDRKNVGKILISPMKEPEPVPVEEPKNKKKTKKGEEVDAKEEAPAEGSEEKPSEDAGVAADAIAATDAATAEAPKAEEAPAAAAEEEKPQVEEMEQEENKEEPKPEEVKTEEKADEPKGEEAQEATPEAEDKQATPKGEGEEVKPEKKAEEEETNKDEDSAL